jgi:hypothetical protein
MGESESRNCSALRSLQFLSDSIYQTYRGYTAAMEAKKTKRVWDLKDRLTA